MDTSFDVFGAGGWGADQGENEFQPTQTHRSNSFEKLPVPVTITDLVKNASFDSEQETFKVGNYQFKTIRVVGKVANFSTDGNTNTYELVPYNGDVKTSKRFTVIRHVGNDIGLLRVFNDRLSLLAYHIRESNKDEAELFDYEARLMKYYYGENMPDLSVHQMDKFSNTIFATGTMGTKVEAKSLMATQKTLAATSLSANRPTQSPNASNANRQMQSLYTASQQTSGRSQKQQRIYNYILEKGQDETGVSLDNIKRDLKITDISEDIAQLLGDGCIYSTIDDDHYAPVNQ